MMKRFICVVLLLVWACLLGGCITVEYVGDEGATNDTSATEHKMVFVERKDVIIDEQTYVGLFYDYTNNSGETIIPADAIDVKAFQDGIELCVTVFTGTKTEGAIQCDTNVQSGTTARVVWLFEKASESPVSVEMSDGQKFVIE